jgi:hypothetical protein
MVKGGAALPHELMIRTRFGSAADVLVAKRNEITAALATRTENCARRTFQMSQNCNLPDIARFDASPVAALARGVLDTPRPAAQA